MTKEEVQAIVNEALGAQATKFEATIAELKTEHAKTIETIQADNKVAMETQSTAFQNQLKGAMLNREVSAPEPKIRPISEDII